MKSAQDPTFQQQLCSEVWRPDDFLQYSSAVTKNISRYFMCRDENCRKFGPPDRWCGNGSHFRCAPCFKEYKPWVGMGDPNSKLIPAQ